MSPLIRGLAIEERPLAASDGAEGIDHRWKLSGPNLLIFVIHVRKSAGRWAGPAVYLCSLCRQEPEDPRQPEDGHSFCEHVQRILELPASPRSAV